jgi:hypothetical protein
VGTDGSFVRREKRPRILLDVFYRHAILLHERRLFLGRSGPSRCSMLTLSASNVSQPDRVSVRLWLCPPQGQGTTNSQRTKEIRKLPNWLLESQESFHLGGCSRTNPPGHMCRCLTLIPVEFAGGRNERPTSELRQVQCLESRWL